jgi:3'-5' exoribonuclease
VVLGDRMVRRITDAIPEFPEEKRCHLSHLILSHQGRLEHASPVTPKSLEGVVLHALDLLDSRVATWRDIRSSSESGRRWSDYDRLDGQFWFLGGSPSEQDRGEE